MRLFPVSATTRSPTALRVRARGSLKRASAARPLSPDITRQLFYVFREALNNVEKYAGATHVWVTIDWGAEGLNLSIADNGVGFSPVLVHARGSYGDHYGLKFMRERIERLNGTLSIQTLPNSGSCVSAHVPYDNPLVSLEQVPTHI
jgi:signal transduction histidine kinase